MCNTACVSRRGKGTAANERWPSGSGTGKREKREKTNVWHANAGGIVFRGSTGSRRSMEFGQGRRARPKVEVAHYDYVVPFVKTNVLRAASSVVSRQLSVGRYERARKSGNVDR